MITDQTLLAAAIVGFVAGQKHSQSANADAGGVVAGQKATHSANDAGRIGPETASTPASSSLVLSARKMASQIAPRTNRR
ncbi:hypothetical protein [Hyphomicrobium sp. LHD-15]|uniref:hypothetical protein n=1 Tax=Hyphomicrobium sp. LHD-15 TaxID=3072142 RepID=UPI00280CA4F9|nr:hypothetical protein [Hyphomicrobium sp. LHD-15]MDQ8700221.1 hypothetical protein [Hyphomicrobium sp. LHD-15]